MLSTISVYPGICSAVLIFDLSFFQCSQDCGGGNRTRDVVCQIPRTGEIVNENMCNQQTKPQTFEYCNLDPCKRVWLHVSFPSAIIYHSHPILYQCCSVIYLLCVYNTHTYLIYFLLFLLHFSSFFPRSLYNLGLGIGWDSEIDYH